MTVLGEHPGTYRISVCQNVMIAYWFGRGSEAAVLRMNELTDQLLATLAADTRISYIHLVTNKLELPDAATRSAFIESTKRYADRSAVSGVVVSGSGFWASAIRGFVTGIAVLAPRSFDLRIFATAAELVAWFPAEHARRTGVQLDPDALLRHLEHAQKSDVPEAAAS